MSHLLFAVAIEYLSRFILTDLSLSFKIHQVSTL